MLSVQVALGILNMTDTAFGAILGLYGLGVCLVIGIAVVIDHKRNSHQSESEDYQ